MHRLVAENLEKVLTTLPAGNRDTEDPARAHLLECAECREEVAAMRQQALLLQSLRAPVEELEPRAGFYARVMERIEAQAPASFWNVFETMFGRRLAIASLALAMLLGVYLISTDQTQEELTLQNVPDAAVEMLPVPVTSGQFVALHDNAGVMSLGEPNEDSVLVNLVTYREQ